MLLSKKTQIYCNIFINFFNICFSFLLFRKIKCIYNSFLFVIFVIKKMKKKKAEKEDISVDFLEFEDLDE